MTTESLATVKAQFSRIIDDVSGSHERVTVTRNGTPVAVILAVEDYESVMETLAILSDPLVVEDLSAARQELAAGGGHGEDAVRAALAARRG